MRLTAIALITLMVTACGDDDTEETQPYSTPQPSAASSRSAPPADTAGETAVADAEGSDTTARDRVDEGDAATGQRRTESQADTPAAEGQRLYTIQVGAFTEMDTAREWAGRLESQGLPVWVSMSEIGGQTFYRLRVGAVSSVSDARRLGSMLTERYEWPVWVAPVTPADRLPQGAVQRTRRMLEGP